MKSKIIIVCSVVVSIILVALISLFYNEASDNNIISNISKNKEVISSNMITMMYETDAGTGIYEETKDTTWPESGYIFNENLSGCENGGELEYNSGNNTVNLLSNSSDRCYVYFDKYDGVWIDNVVATNVTGSSITLDISATSENGSIKTYYYAINDSEEYIETTTNPIIIDDLNKLTEYNIKIYAIDNTGAKSNIYEISVSTTDVSVPVINSVEVSDVTENGFTLTVNASSEVDIKRYYFIIDDSGDNLAGASTNNNYTFVNLMANTSYNLIVFVEDINGVFSDRYNLGVQTINLQTLSEYIKSLYTSQGANGIYYHTQGLSNSAGDNSYRYAGANPSNYICFGSDYNNCPDENLYRIIGVFDDEVKLIKSSSYGSYSWSGSSSTNNMWANSSLNVNILNGGYYNSFNSLWTDLISIHDWKIGGMDYSESYTAKNYYDREVGNSSSSITYSASIGLMYVSDYGFAASNSYWTTSLYDYDDAARNNWLRLGSNEWTITRYSGSSNIAFRIYSSGYVNETGTVNYSFAVRPTFYLNSDVQYESGSGTQTDPFRIKFD